MKVIENQTKLLHLAENLLYWENTYPFAFCCYKEPQNYFTIFMGIQSTSPNV